MQDAYKYLMRVAYGVLIYARRIYVCNSHVLFEIFVRPFCVILESFSTFWSKNEICVCNSHKSVSGDLRTVCHSYTAAWGDLRSVCHSYTAVWGDLRTWETYGSAGAGAFEKSPRTKPLASPSLNLWGPPLNDLDH